MCGIAGYWLREGKAELPRLRAMCDAIRHRGPDDEGFHVDGGCAIGMRRLSIIDLATGHQPISNEDGTVWVVFNGEIYNYQELRQELLEQGHRFATNSDTETLIHLYEQEGEAGITRLRGMFAYAIWDSRRRRLLLARDRFGKKPLYYAALPEGFFFASELKSLLAAGVPPDVDTDALKLYLHFGYIPDPRSPYHSVYKLPPGHWLVAGPGGIERQGRYWELPPPREDQGVGLDEEVVCREIREVFDESVRLRMIADVPLGAFLSGGIDSSLVVASMARQSKEPIKTFSIGFEERAYNELPAASILARRYGTDHHELVVRPDAVDLVRHLIGFLDEPFADSSAIPTYLVSQLAVEHVKVVLSGDGGDELFGGYETFFTVDRRRWADALPQALRRGISAVADSLPNGAYGKNFLRTMSRPTALERYFEEIAFSSHSLRHQVLEKEWWLHADAAFLRRTFGSAILPDTADCLSQAMHFEATAKLAGDILVKVDRMSMANSLEVRCPLLDHRLAEVAMTIPNSWKTRDGKGKRILLKALGDRLPPELLDRPRQGFGVPLPIWFRGPLRELLWDHLTSSSFCGRGIVSAPQVRAMLEEHDRGRRDNATFLWLLLVLELWLTQGRVGAQT
jgi:asparagine synthase (glutamine-hydrolysing)